MKKIIFTIILMFLLLQPVFSEEIKDELLDNLNVNLSEKTLKPLASPIIDEIVEAQERGEIPFQLQVSITDKNSKEITTEDIIKELIKLRTNNVRKIGAKNVYNFSKKPVILKIKVADTFDKKYKFIEGEHITFELLEPVTINNKTFKEGTKVIGRIEMFSASDRMGTPENIKIDNFYIVDEKNKEININGHVSKAGANRSYWVYPLYQAGNFAFYAAGYVFVPIHGGRVKLSDKDVFTIFWEPK